MAACGSGVFVSCVLSTDGVRRMRLQGGARRCISGGGGCRDTAAVPCTLGGRLRFWQVVHAKELACLQGQTPASLGMRH